MLSAVICGVLALALSAPGAGATGGSSFVRVNQLGYPAGAPKRAFLMSSADRPGAAFQVVDATGRAVLSGHVGGSTGSWSDAYPSVRTIDFSSLRAAGTYTIRVAGAPPSPRFRIGTGAAVYAHAIANARRFYEVQRDGPDFVRSALRSAPGHLNDENAMTYSTPKVDGDGIFQGDLHALGTRIDASGGWWDAGDYLKFLHATSYTEAVLLTGVRDFPKRMGPAAGSGDFTGEVRFGAEWLLRMWDDPTRTLYYQVGIGSGNDDTYGDHDIWRLPQDDDTYGGSDPLYRYIRHRPVFRAGPAGSPISPNLAGRDSAALALCYQVFHRTRPAFAARCLQAARHIFALADTAPKGRLLTAIPYDYYPETEWRDDLELGATELARAMMVAGRDPHAYLVAATHWARAYVNGPNDAADTLNLYDTSGLAHYELYRAIGHVHNRTGFAITRAGLLADMRRSLDRAVAQSATDPFRFGFGWAQWDTTTHGAGLSVMASEYDQLSGTRRYASIGTGWLDDILGANAWGSSLIIGDGTEYPHCPQHQVANLAGSLDGSAPVLAGAAVEGPNGEIARGRVAHMRTCPGDGVDRFAAFNSEALFKDDVQSYPTVEPAIDLTATSPLAFARQASGLF
jgi:endoglucanase